jgi:inositol hexakisphosphate/diphosphoinositol-pentakisphosphate kinase
MADNHQANAPTKIKLGLCAMEKKTGSKPMQEILSRIVKYGEFEVIRFTNDQITNAPVAEWPKCDALISFFSSGFPLEKAIDYVKLHPSTLQVNALDAQTLLLDRRHVYRILQENNIPVPTHMVVNRDNFDEKKKDPELIENEDYVELRWKNENGEKMSQRVNKPFVEKPVDAEDHNIYIYYPMSVGGGSKRLFRKIKDCSSKFYADVNTIRREGSYIYEEFVITQGTDVKVYTVGQEYAHAEARKSPVLDGKVLRNTDGKEMRYPVILSPEEKEYARKIVVAFKQRICGFDLLRTSEGTSFVCDVNGWSFVKSSKKYYEDTSAIMRGFFLTGGSYMLPPMAIPLNPKGTIKPIH